MFSHSHGETRGDGLLVELGKRGVEVDAHFHVEHFPVFTGTNLEEIVLLVDVVDVGQPVEPRLPFSDQFWAETGTLGRHV